MAIHLGVGIVECKHSIEDGPATMEAGEEDPSKETNVGLLTCCMSEDKNIQQKSPQNNGQLYKSCLCNLDCCWRESSPLSGALSAVLRSWQSSSC